MGKGHTTVFVGIVDRPAAPRLVEICWETDPFGWDPDEKEMSRRKELDQMDGSKRYSETGSDGSGLYPVGHISKYVPM